MNLMRIPNLTRLLLINNNKKNTAPCGPYRAVPTLSGYCYKNISHTLFLSHRYIIETKYYIKKDRLKKCLIPLESYRREIH